MNITQDERKLLKELVKKELEVFEKEEKTIIEISPGFLSAEVKYDLFLKDLLNKLGE